MNNSNKANGNNGKSNPIKSPSGNKTIFEKRGDTGRHTDRTTSSKPGAKPPGPKK